MKGDRKQAVEWLMKDIRQFSMLGVMLLIYMVVVSRLFGAFCPVRLFSGLPCPGCGITRATVFLLTGRWQMAWQMNPVVFPIIAAVLYCGINRYLLGKKVRGTKWIIAGIVVLLLVVYVERMTQYFPGREPYSYFQSNFLERMLPAYREMLLKMVEAAKRISKS